MAYRIRNATDEYWSYENGWSEYKSWADYFDEPLNPAVTRPPIGGIWEQVPDHIAGLYGLKALRDDFDKDDQYGWCISWHFALCDTLLFQCDTQTPDHWCFTPSPMGAANDDEHKDEVLSRLSDKQLLYVGEILHRYAAMLDRAGKSY